MDFRLTRDQTDIQQAAREFARGEFDPELALRLDREQNFPLGLWRKACEFGFVGVHFPELYEGPGFGQIENALVVEAFCRQESGIGAALALADAGASLILRFGDEEQKRNILPPVVQGRAMAAVALSEGGYALSPMKTRIEPTPGGLCINGRKRFVPLAGTATSLVVLGCESGNDPAAQSAVVLGKDLPGIQVSGETSQLGLRATPLAEVGFNRVIAPERDRLGPPGGGKPVIDAYLQEIRVETAAMGVGLAQGCLDRAVAHSRRREQFGRSISAFDAVRNKLADMLVETEMARLITYRAAWSLDHGRATRSPLLAKQVAARAACRVASDSLQVHGGSGYMTETHIERFFRDAKVLDLFVEPGRLQRKLLADEILNQPGRSRQTWTS